MCPSALAVAGSLCLKRVGQPHKEEEVKSICPLTGGMFTPYWKVLLSVRETKVKEALV